MTGDGLTKMLDGEEMQHTDLTVAAGAAVLVQNSQAEPHSRASASSAKRALDIVLAASALIFLLPLLACIAALVKLDPSGPVLFRQTRGGLRGQPFTILKFRTMRVVEDGDDVVQATKGDDRVTRVGAFLRRSSLDELPQLFNVLRGDMSIVGPRPHALIHDAHYAALIPHYEGRTRAKPGITGLAQVRGARGETATLEQMLLRINLDNEYVDRWSFGLDIKLITQTALMLPFDQKAY